MSCTLTDYRRPHPHYGLADAGWRARTPWEVVEGRFQRLYIIRRKYAVSRWRKAQIFRHAGVWSWRVLERSGGELWREIARASASSGHVYFSAQSAMPFAELAATTK
jgi:hypothetical protein